MSKQHKSCFSSCLVKLLTFFLIVGTVAFFGITFIQKQANPNQSKTGLFEREASVKDLYVEESYSFPISVSWSITPYSNIEDLQLTIYYHNDNGQVIKTQIKQIGDVQKGQTYSFKISLTDFDLSETLEMDRCTYIVSRGTISYFD